MDLFEHKYLKVSLIAFKGRHPSKTPLLNELAYEQVVTTVAIKVREFEEGKPVACNIAMNRRQYGGIISEEQDE
jgi:hypothetical protein